MWWFSAYENILEPVSELTEAVVRILKDFAYGYCLSDVIFIALCAQGERRKEGAGGGAIFEGGVGGGVLFAYFNISRRARRAWEQSFAKFKMAATTSTSLVSYVSYDSDSSNEEIGSKDLPDDNENTEDNTVDVTALKSKILLNSAPAVTAKVEMKTQNKYFIIKLPSRHANFK